MKTDWKCLKDYVMEHRVDIEYGPAEPLIKDATRRTCASGWYFSCLGFLGSVHHDDEDLVFHGKIVNIADFVSFEGNNLEALRNDFRKSVRDYIKQCMRLKRAIQMYSECDKPEKEKGLGSCRTGMG